MSRAFPIALGAVAVAALIGAVVTLGVGAWGDDEPQAVVYAPGLGMMSGDGSGGMMGTGPGMMGAYGADGSSAAPESVGTMAEAAGRVEDWLTGVGFDGLRVAEVMAFTDGYYVAVEEAGGEGAFELIVDPATGWIAPEPGPNMMWNTSYGMMGGRFGYGMMMGGGMMGGPSSGGLPSAEEVSAAEAAEIANQWLSDALPGEEAGEPRAFPGYYTLDTERAGHPQGMLSVNAATGAVWYHVWHGGFLDELEL